MGMLSDGFQNVAARLGFGQARDKASVSGYGFTALTADALEATYRSSALARKIVDMPAEDAAREWREWQAKADQITAIEAEEKRLALQGKLIHAKKAARLMGGAAIYMHLPGDPGLPVNLNAIRKGGLAHLTVVSRDALHEGEIETDPREPGYGKPRNFRLRTAGANDVLIHPSRLVILTGEELPVDSLLTARSVWGDSVLQSLRDTLMRLDLTEAGVASLVTEAKVDVLKINGLFQNLQAQGKPYEDALIKRAELAAGIKGINGQLIIDKDDDYQQKSASFSGLPDIIDRFIQLVAADAGIPVTLLFGKSPAGLNSTGDADIRGYYDRVKVVQTLEHDPAMAVLNEALIRSALGARPPEIHFAWRPLWQPTAKERAEVGKSLADTLKVLADMNAVPIEVLGRTAVNALTEAGVFPGMEADAEKFFGSGGEDDTDPAEEGADMRNADAAPRTLYVRRDVLNGDEILAWARKQGFGETLTADDLHVTIAYSRTPLDWMKTGEAWQDKIEIAAGGARLMEQFGEARVLLFNSSELAWRHETIKEAGASWDHPEYQPHLTISYDPAAPDLAKVEPYRGRILLGPEIFEELNLDWKPEVTGESA